MNKMTLERFREIKKRVLEMASISSDVQVDEEEFFAEFNSYMSELQRYDLSDIPFEEWEGMYLVAENLDMSKTHANLDFSLIQECSYETANFRGCNLRNLQEIYYNEEDFDADFKREHPEFFPDDTIPDEVKKKFYERKINLNDLIQYPSLRKCVGKSSFRYNHRGVESLIVNKIGLKNFLQFIEDYPELSLYCFSSEGEFDYVKVSIQKEIDISSSPTYEEAKKYLFEQILFSARKNYGIDVRLDLFPREMIELFPNVFISDGELPEDVIKNYYEGNLSIGQVRYYYDILSKYDIALGVKSSRSVQYIIKIFGSVEEYLSQVPMELDGPITKYLNRFYYDDEQLKLYQSLSLEEKFTVAIRHSVSDYYFYAPLKYMKVYSQYVPLSSLFKSELVVKLIEQIGLDALIEYNAEHGYIIDEIFDLIDEIDSKGMEIEAHTPEELVSSFKQVIQYVRNRDSYSLNKFINRSRKRFEKLFPEEYLDYNLLEEMYSNMNEDERDKFIKDIERAFNGDTDKLIKICNTHPELIPILEEKDIVFTIRYSSMSTLLERIGTKNYFHLILKYQDTLNMVLSSFDESELDDFCKYIKSHDDYEQYVNDVLYYSLRHKKTFDIRKLPDSFKQVHPELYLDDNAPYELMETFYGRQSYSGMGYTKLSIEDIHKHPDWIPYLLHIDLDLSIENIMVNVVDSSYQGPQPVMSTSLIGLMQSDFSNREILEFFAQYGGILKRCIYNGDLNVTLDVNESREEQLSTIVNKIYHCIVNEKVHYDDTILPDDFIAIHPELFLSSDAPEELYNLFYQKKLVPGIIQEHPEWCEFLLNKKMNLGFNRVMNVFFESCPQLDNDIILELFKEYGNYIYKATVQLNQNVKNIEEIRSLVKSQIVKSILEGTCFYGEDLYPLLGEEYPSLFLDFNAPQELKNRFYEGRDCDALDFYTLKEHKDWLPYLESKNVMLIFTRKDPRNEGLRKLFTRYGTEEAIRIGIKNPSAVEYMLTYRKEDLLFTWYDKLHFIPHQMVMLLFPVSQTDKFMSSGKKWSQIMRIEGHNRAEEDIFAMLKAAMTFGVFDDDMDGFHKFMQLFSDIPRELTQEEMTKLEEHFDPENRELIAFRIDFLDTTSPDIEKDAIKEVLELRALLKNSYVLDERGKYVLRINTQRNKAEMIKLRSMMEEANIGSVLTSDRAHKLFGGFEMKYDASFRDFLLDNIDLILSSDEYISYMSSIQKQWNEIKALNSNRVLTLDLALAFVKTNSYQDVEYGNERLAEVASSAGYDQRTFNILQQIYNYGKIRTYSSIPRVKTNVEGYSYEMLRLDDPLAVAIGTLSDCCQELDNAAEVSMEHSMVSEHGRVFVIKDEEGNIVAQSWVWRNKNVVCFDNIEVPSKAFNRARLKGIDREKLSDIIFHLYQQAAEEIIAKDEEVFRKLFEEGKITEVQFEMLRIRKVTVGRGYNDIADSLRRNSSIDATVVARPLHFKEPVQLTHTLYTNDSETQYVIAGEEEVPTSEEETPTVYQDEFVILDDSNMKQRDVLSLNKLELATKGEKFEGNTQVYRKDRFVSEIAWNYDLDPTLTKIVMHSNFAIIYEETEKEIVLADLFYNIKINISDDIEVLRKVAVQIRLALEQIKNNKEFNIRRLDKEQVLFYNMVMGLEKELDEERGLSHGTR